MIGLVTMLIGRANDPRGMNGIWRMFGISNGPAGNELADERIDTRLRVASRSHDLADAVVIGAKPAPQAGPSPEKRWLPGVRKELLNEIRDDRVFLASEHPAFFHLLEILAKTDPRVITRNSSGNVTFLQLFKQPNLYRGELVTVSGQVHGVFRKVAPANESKIREYYQVWIEPGEHADPIAIYCLTLPNNFPQGEGMDEQVAVTGFFFKRWAYRARDEIRTAPLLLAKSLDWRPKQHVQAPVPGGHELGYAVLGAGILSLLIVGVLWRRTRRADRPKFKLSASTQSPDLSQAEFLADLSTRGNAIPNEGASMSDQEAHSILPTDDVPELLRRICEPSDASRAPRLSNGNA